MNETEIKAEEHLGLVRLCSNRFRNRGIEYEELYSAGCIGLLKAIKAFDTERGVKFSTYAVPVILGEIKRLFRDGGYIKVSRSLKELSSRLMREREQFIKIYGREPAISELCEITGVDEALVVEALSASHPPVSLSEMSSEDSEGGGQMDIPVESPDMMIEDILALRQIMGKLDKDDRKLIYMRYYKNKTQTETAEALNMTQVQVSRREKKLISLMREEMLR